MKKKSISKPNPPKKKAKKPAAPKNQLPICDFGGPYEYSPRFY